MTHHISPRTARPALIYVGDCELIEVYDSKIMVIDDAGRYCHTDNITFDATPQALEVETAIRAERDARELG